MASPSSTAVYTTSLTEKRPLIGEELRPATTIGAELAASVERAGACVQYVTPAGEEVTKADFAQRARTAARALVSLGIGPGDGAAILGANSLEWFIADVGSTLAGAVPVGVYTSNHQKVVSYIIQHSRGRVAFVDNQADLMKILSIKAECPLLATIVYWGGDIDLAKFSDHKDYLLSFQEFLALGTENHDAVVTNRLAAAEPADCCKIIYTSGTTGPPKAVMISHANIMAALEATKIMLNVTEKDVMVSFLPVSHIAANMIDIMGPVCLDFSVHIAPADALRGSLVDTLRKVRPTIFLAVPRVWEKIREKMLAIGAEKGPVVRLIGKVAKHIGSAATDAEDKGENLPLGTGLAEKIVFSNIRQTLGLDRARACFNSTAPLQQVTDDYFRSLRLRILDLYGASEATGPLTANSPTVHRRGTSGKAIPGINTKITAPDGSGEVAPAADGSKEGELCFKGRNIFMGYLWNPEESRKTIDDEGFYHTGDLGRIDKDGFITITGRLKELIITAGGENVAPLLVEGGILKAMPAISRAFAIGDKRKFVSCLLIPYFDENGKLDGLSKAVNPAISTVEEAMKDPAWKKYLEEGMAEANKDAISNAAKVKKWRLLERDFTVEDGELTPTLKVKREIVVNQFKDEIDKIYE